MNKLIYVLVMLIATSVSAAPSVTYQCSGVETLGNVITAVNAEISYSNWSQGAGYATQTILLSDQDPNSNTKRPSVNLQELRDVANTHDCASLTEMEVQTTPNKDYTFLKFEFNFNCVGDKDNHYKLETYCEQP